MDIRHIPEKDRELFVDKIFEALDMVEFMKLVKPFPETLETVVELHKRGKRLAIVSNNDTNHIKAILDLLDFPNVFETIVGSDSGARSKPNPDMLFVAFDRMGVFDASRSCYVGDSEQDGDTAVAGGIGSIIVDRHDLHARVPGEKCRSLSEILNFD